MCFYRFKTILNLEEKYGKVLIFFFKPAGFEYRSGSEIKAKARSGKNNFASTQNWLDDTSITF
jgi:hypothetical protein